MQYSDQWIILYINKTQSDFFEVQMVPLRLQNQLVVFSSIHLNTAKTNYIETTESQEKNGYKICNENNPISWQIFKKSFNLL